jgi:hypothetical protein
MPFSKLHIVGNALMIVGSTVVYSCAIKGSWRWTLAGIAIGTLGGVALLMAPSPFDDVNSAKRGAK